MAYASTVAAALKILDAGFTASPSSGAGISAGGSIYKYCSSHSSTQMGAVTGFFTGCGAQVFHSTGVHPNVVTRSTQNIGMRPGDLVVNIESSGGATPCRVTWHGVTASTWGGSTAAFVAGVGYD